MSYSERTQVLLTPEQRARLERIAAQRGISLGAAIREAIDTYGAPPARSRADALDALFQLEAPVDEWDTMKREIIEGASG